MVTRTRIRQVLMLALLAGYYTIEQPTARAAQDEFCDQICWSGAYCGAGCYDEANQTYTDCWGYSGGNCTYEYPCYPNVNWVETSRTQIGLRTDWEPSWFFPFYWDYCFRYYRVSVTNNCPGVDDRDFCERVQISYDPCPAPWGQKCDEAGLECSPGSSCE